MSWREQCGSWERWVGVRPEDLEEGEEEEEEGGIAVGGTAGVKPGPWERRAGSLGQGQDVSHRTGCFTQDRGCKLAVSGPYMAPRCVAFGSQC